MSGRVDGWVRVVPHRWLVWRRKEDVCLVCSRDLPQTQHVTPHHRPCEACTFVRRPRGRTQLPRWNCRRQCPPQLPARTHTDRQAGRLKESCRSVCRLAGWPASWLAGWLDGWMEQAREQGRTTHLVLEVATDFGVRFEGVAYAQRDVAHQEVVRLLEAQCPPLVPEVPATNQPTTHGKQASKQAKRKRK